MDNGSSSERGQALILIVFVIAALFGAAGLAIDGGNLYAERRRAQNAADAAALAGALARINGESWVDTTYRVAGENGFKNNGKTTFIEVHSPPITGTYKGNIEYIQVRIRSSIRTPFASVVGVPQMSNLVEAVARSKPAEYKQMFDGAAVVSLAVQSDCDNEKSFWVHAELTLSLEGGGLFVNSLNPDCALMQQANGSIRIHGNYPLQVVGGWQISKPSLMTPYPPTHTAGVPYPPPFYMPKVNCNKDAEISLDGTSMSPGNWGDQFPPEGVINLESGTYCLGGDFIMGGAQKLTGRGVLFFMTGGQFHISGGANFDLSAGHSGQNDGLLVYQPMENKHPVILNMGADSTFTGTVLAPGAEVRIKGSDSASGFHSQIVGYTINADGNSNVIIRYSDSENYDALYWPEVQFIK